MDRRRLLPTYHYEDNTNGNLQKSVEKNLRDYKIYGDSVQNGTPSPDNPIEIKNVGEKTGNILKIDVSRGYPSHTDFSNITKREFNFNTYVVGLASNNYYYVQPIEDYNVQKNSISIKSASGYGLGWVLKLDNSKQYSITYNASHNGHNGNVVYYQYDGTYISNDLIRETGTTKKSSLTFTPPEGTYYTVILFAPSYTIQQNVTYSNIMLNEGAAAMQYEPYGYKIPVNIKGKNLLDRKNCIHLGSGITDFIFKSGKTYTVSMSGNNLAVDNFSWWLTTGKTSYSDDTTRYFMLYSKTIPQMATFTPTEDTSLAVCIAGTPSWQQFENFINGAYFVDIQIEESSTASSYEPYYEQTTIIYLDEPLRKIGNYADYIDFKNKKIVRYFNLQTILKDDITLNTGIVRDDVVFAHFAKPTDSKAYTDPWVTCLALCDRAVFLQTYTFDSRMIGKFNSWVAKNNWDFGFAPNTTLETIKNLLDGGKILYELATPTDETIDLPDIPTPKGNGIITVDTLIQPSQLNWQYYRSK